MEGIKMLQQSTLDDDMLSEIIDAVFDSSSSDSEASSTYKKPHGSRPGRAPNVNRGHAMGADRLYQDYFAPNAVYNERLFRRRFRMQRELFIRIVQGIKTHDEYFEQRFDALNVPGLSTLQKITAAIHQLAYGTPADACDEYIRISESTAQKCLDKFAQAMIDKYGPVYLRSPTPEDLERTLRINAARGFPDCAGSLDCYAWRWDKCPKAKQGQYKGHKGTSIILEAAVDGDLWFWHAHVGFPGSLNDINVVQRSSLICLTLHDIVNGACHQVSYVVNHQIYTTPYWLVDGIYPR
ncbi:hypothetical protein AaE_011626 [Aphanomyces astaci]|uniref:DDE Tnp4 domain-containing protein n=1 Tax=Aphanomyces astaci TaxID=112090 RepID=A0A6A4ZHV7_APHAT|nr:hypothetical protein AaE_011626 [Aphanomyces astaci]